MTASPPPRADIPKLAELPLAIETPRLRLRPLVASDADAIWPHASDPELSKLMSWSAHRDIDETRAFVASQAEALANGTDVTWAIQKDGETCGAIGLHSIRWHLRAWRVDRAVLGYWIARPLWGQGLVTEAAQAVIGWAFETAGFHKVTVGCLEENVGSRRVIEKLGFRFLGRAEEHMWRDGSWHPHLDYELTAGEWGDSARTLRFSRPSRPA
jgi:[ribosomal protein S5]-alanine N-acetyltransferase